jgi:hypothetical protein
MRNNGGIIGTGSSYRRKGAAPTSSGVWSTDNAKRFEQSGRPTNNLNELVFLGYYENISSDTTSATQTFSNVSLGPPLTHGKRIIAAIGYNQGALGAVGISSANLAIDSAASQLTGTIIEASGTAGHERTAVAYWDVPASAGGSEIADITINYNSAFTSSAGDQGTIIGLYYIEDETEIVQTVWNATTRYVSLGSHAVTYAQSNGYAIAVAGHGGSSTSNTITFAGATEDFEFKPDPTANSIFAGASKTSDTIGEVTITPTPESEYGVTTVVTFGKTYDYEAVLTSAGSSGYLAPTYTVTDIPSTGAGVSDDETSDFLVAIDIDNFDNTDTGILYEIGGGGNGIAIGMVSGELRVNFADGGDTYDGVSNTGVDIERDVASTTMDNFNGIPITLYVGLDRSTGNLRIGLQSNLRGSGNQFTSLVNITVTVPTGILQGGNAPGYGQVGSTVADIGTSANYAGTITEIRAWNNESTLDVSRLTTVSN